MWLWGALRKDKYGRTMQQHWILCSSRFLYQMQDKNCSRSLFTFTGFKKKKKSCATNNTGRKEQYIRHSLLNHRHRQSTEVFECHKNTVTRQTSLQRRRRRLFGKHCSNFVFPVKTKTLGPVCLGCEGCRCIRSLVDIHYDAFLQLEQTRDKKYIQKTCLGLSLVKCTEGISII